MKRITITTTINDPVWVKLTSTGLKVQKAYCDNLSIPEPTPNPLGYFKYTLWKLVLIFGKSRTSFQKNTIYLTRPSD